VQEGAQPRAARSARQVLELVAYFAKRVGEAAEAPKDDVIGDLVRACEGGEALTRDEVISILLQILTAGNESTTSLIGSALHLLLENPQIEERIRNDRALLEPFIEEALRLESPFRGHFRLVRRDTEVAGQPLAEGSRVMLRWGAARDAGRARDALRAHERSAARRGEDRARTQHAGALPHRAAGRPGDVRGGACGAAGACGSSRRSSHARQELGGWSPEGRHDAGPRSASSPSLAGDGVGAPGAAPEPPPRGTTEPSG
jgi:hypothetical protein